MLSVLSVCAVLCCAVLCCAVLCCAVLCCAVLCCAVLCCAVLCCAVLCCAVLCCAVLCCAVLCCAVLCCAVLSVCLSEPLCSSFPLCLCSVLIVQNLLRAKCRKPDSHPNAVISKKKNLHILSFSPSRQGEPRFSDRPVRLCIFLRNFHVVNALSRSEPRHGRETIARQQHCSEKKLQQNLTGFKQGQRPKQTRRDTRRAFGSDSVALVTAAIAVHSCGMRASALCSATSKPHSSGRDSTASTLSS